MNIIPAPDWLREKAERVHDDGYTFVVVQTDSLAQSLLEGTVEFSRVREVTTDGQYHMVALLKNYDPDTEVYEFAEWVGVYNITLEPVVARLARHEVDKDVLPILRAGVVRVSECAEEIENLRILAES